MLTLAFALVALFSQDLAPSAPPASAPPAEVSADDSRTARRGERIEALAKLGLERVLSRVLEAPVQVGEVKRAAGGEGLELRQVSIGNPKGYSEGTALSADSVLVEADLQSLLSREPEIRLVSASGVQVNAESKLPFGSNLTTLLKNARDAKPEGPLRDRMQKRWRIHKAVLQQANVKMDSPLAAKSAQERTLSDIEMSFGGEDGRGIPAQQAVAQFMARLVQELEILPVGGAGAEDSPVNRLLDLFNRAQ